MQERSLLVLGSAFYAPDVIAAFLTEIGTMDDAVVDEGHYFVAATADAAIPRQRRLVAQDAGLRPRGDQWRGGLERG